MHSNVVPGQMERSGGSSGCPNMLFKRSCDLSIVLGVLKMGVGARHGVSLHTVVLGSVGLFAAEKYGETERSFIAVGNVSGCARAIRLDSARCAWSLRLHSDTHSSTCCSSCCSRSSVCLLSGWRHWRLRWAAHCNVFAVPSSLLRTWWRSRVRLRDTGRTSVAALASATPCNGQTLMLCFKFELSRSAGGKKRACTVTGLADGCVALCVCCPTALSALASCSLACCLSAALSSDWFSPVKLLLTQVGFRGSHLGCSKCDHPWMKGQGWKCSEICNNVQSFKYSLIFGWFCSLAHLRVIAVDCRAQRHTSKCVKSPL